MGVDGSLYKFLLLLHVSCAVLGFGALAFNGFYLVRARRQGGPAGIAIVEANDDVSRIAELLIYAVFVLGLLLVLTSTTNHVQMWKFSQGWLSAAMALYIVDLGVLHGFIRRRQRRYNELIHEVNGAAEMLGVLGAGPPDGVPELIQLEQRISIGWATFDAVFLIVIYLRVFKPGS
jgi:uncharacterized membrane protein